MRVTEEKRCQAGKFRSDGQIFGGAQTGRSLIRRDQQTNNQQPDPGTVGEPRLGAKKLFDFR